MGADSAGAPGYHNAMWLFALVLSVCGAGCGIEDCEPASAVWQINVGRSPMIVVDNTPEIRVGDRLIIDVLADLGFCPGADPVVSVRWQLSDPGVANLTPGPFLQQATILGTASGETRIAAEIGFGDGTRTQTSRLWALGRSELRDVLRVVP